MNTTELIRHRRSVRTFDGRALRPEDAQAVLNCAVTASNPYNIPIQWKLLSAKEQGLSSPVIVGTDCWFAGKLSKVPHAEEAFGYAMETVVLYAESLGLGTTWIAGTMDRAAFERAMELGEGEAMPCVSPLGYPAEKMSLRETVMRKGVGADRRMNFEDLFFEQDFEHPLTPDAAGKLASSLELVRWTPSAVNKQPWRAVVMGDSVHFYEKHSKGYVGADGWDLQKVDLGIGLCHFALGLEAVKIEADFVLNDPGLTAPPEMSYIASYLLH